jgi:hypothetical protein
LLFDFFYLLKHNWGMIAMLDDKWLTVKQAADMIGCTEDHVRLLLRKGPLVGKKLSERMWLVDVTSAAKMAYSTTKRGRPRTSPKS